MRILLKLISALGNFDPKGSCEIEYDTDLIIPKGSLSTEAASENGQSSQHFSVERVSATTEARSGLSQIKTG
jgi:hypothetical protein